MAIWRSFVLAWKTSLALRIMVIVNFIIAGLWIADTPIAYQRSLSGFALGFGLSEILRGREDLRKLRAFFRPKKKLKVGQIVLIRTGPGRNFSGEISEISGENASVIVTLFNVPATFQVALSDLDLTDLE